MNTKKSTLSWALYDFANSAYATVVMTAFYPLFFSTYWSQGTAIQNTSRLGIINAISSLLVVVSAPILGAIADSRKNRKTFLFIFILAGGISTLLLATTPESAWLKAACLFILANFAFQGANSFYDSLLVFVSDKSNVDKVSALGYALGYIGGGVALVIGVYATINPGVFNLEDTIEAVKFAFVVTGCWWLIFSLPLFVFVNEKRDTSANTTSILTSIQSAFKELLHTFKNVKKLKNTFLFLIAYFVYIDGVYTIMRMAVDYGMAIGLDSKDLVKALILTQFIAFPATLIYGYIGSKVGAKKAILFGILCYALLTLYAVFAETERDFYIIAALVGLVQGGLQSMSRALYAQMVPRAHTSEFFGFYNMLGKLSAVMGPLLVASITYFTHSNRIGISSGLIVFAIGAYLLSKVDTEEGIRVAASYD